jgi:hypothetical protein
MNSSSSSSSSILFPIGVLAVPGEDVDGCVDIRNFLLEKCKSFDVQGDCVNNCPIIVYPLLKKRWRNTKPDLSYRNDYIDKIKQCFDLLSRAEVAHLDARPVNIMWKPISESLVEIKLIDFEDVLAFGDVVPHRIVDFVVISDDKRYPFCEDDQNKQVIVCNNHNLFFFFAISKWVESETIEFKDFMKENDNHYQILILCNLKESNPSDDNNHEYVDIVEKKKKKKEEKKKRKSDNIEILDTKDGVKKKRKKEEIVEENNLEIVIESSYVEKKKNKIKKNKS